MTRAFKRWLCLLLTMTMLFVMGGCELGAGKATEPAQATSKPPGTEENNETTAPTETATIETSPQQATTATEPDETQPQEITPAETDPPPAVEVTPSEPAHTHSYSATNTVSPTCTTQGYTTFTCSCGSSYQDNVTQATGHSWGAWTVTKEATTSAAGEQARNCAKCGATESQAIAQLPAETPTEPAGCQHSWNMNYYPEQGHYSEYFVVCTCGYSCQTTAQWGAHVDSFSLEEALLYHGSNASARDYIVDSPERYEWICSKCGAVTDTQP